MDIKAFNDRIDARMVIAVCQKLGTTAVTIVEHRPTGRGVQTVPVFRVPPDLRAKAEALGLTVAA
jgi:hypothetical protein